MKKSIIQKHILIPQHSKLSEKDIKELLQRYNVSIKQLPRIKASDSAVKSLNVKGGDVVKIVRRSPTNNESVFYRVVVDA